MIFYILFGMTLSIIYFLKVYRKKLYILISYFILIIIITTMFIFMKFPFSPDSYSYYEISKSIFSDFGEINTIRQYVVNTRLNISFPPLFPFLIATVNYFFNLGMLGGVILNYFVFIVTIILIDMFMKKLKIKPHFIILIVYLITLNYFYLNELLAARAIPLNILIIILVLRSFSNLNSDVRIKSNLILLGFLNGLMLLNRFDHLFTLSFLILYLLYFLKSKNKIIYFFIFAIALILTLSPWIIYSYINFSSLLITDNSSTFSLVYPLGPLRFKSQEFIIPDIYNSFTLWVKTFIEIRLVNVGKGVLALVFVSFPIVVFILISFIGTILKGINNKKLKHLLRFEIKVVLLYALFRTGLFFLVGYGESRYHLETLFIFSLVNISYLNFFYPKSFNFKKISYILVLLTVVFTVVYYGRINERYLEFSSLIDIYTSEQTREETLMSDDEKIIFEYFSSIDTDEVIILNLSDEISSLKFGALTEINILNKPKINEKDIEALYEFSEIYFFNYVIFDNESLDKYLNSMKLDLDYSIIISDDITLSKIHR